MDRRSSDELGWAAAAVTAVCLWAALAHRHLYADGGAFFTHLLSEPGFFLPRWGRAMAYVWTQWPAVLAVGLGLRDPGLLSWLFGLGLFSGLPLGLWACHRLASRESRPLLVLPFLSAFVLFGLTGSFPISESLVAAAVFWPVWVWILDPRPPGRVQWAVLAAALLLSVASYESFLFFGPLWAAGAAFRLRARPAARGTRIGLIAVIVAGLAACAVASVPSLFVQDPLRGHFLASIKHLRGWRTLWFASASLLCAVGSLLLPPRASRRVRLGLACPAIFFASLLGLFPLFERVAEPGNNYLARVFSLMLPLGLGSLGLLFRPRVTKALEASRWPRRAILALGLAAAFHQGVYVLSWQAYRSQVRAALAARRGPIPFEESLIHPSRPGMGRLWQWNWDWAVALTSLWLGRIEGGPGMPRSVVLCPGADRDARVFCPLNPANAEEYRPLAGYGVAAPLPP